ncbi:hypothetical protein JCM3770_005909 [Rhodotorula araucariae]
MALVSPSPPPPTSLCPAPPPLFARTPSDSHRALPGLASSPPPTATAVTSAASMGASQTGSPAAAGPGASVGAHANLGAPAAPPPTGAGPQTIRPLPSPQGTLTRAGSASLADATRSAPLPSPTAVTGPALVPSRSSSSPPAPSPSASSRPSPTPTPPPGVRDARSSSSSSSLRSASYTLSTAPSSAPSSSSSFAAPAVPALPRLNSMHYGSHSPQTYVSSPAQHHMAQGAAHPTFAGQPFPPFAPAYPHPSYPFLPSPHPGGPNGMPLPGYGQTMQLSAEQQKRMQHYQHQWQMELIKGQQQQAQGDDQRRRASSSPSYYTTPMNYPVSPVPTMLQQQQPQHALPFGMTGPSLPPGAMLPHVNMHGYPTPPGSTEGANRSGGESGSSSGGSGTGRAEAYHPYRRDDRRGDGRSTHASSSIPAQHLTTPPTASGAGGRRPPAHHGRADSSASIAQLAQQSYTQHPRQHAQALPPPVRTGSSSSVSSLADRSSGPASPAGSARHVPLPVSGSSSSSLRQRTDSQNSSSSSSSLRHARHDSSSSSISQQRVLSQQQQQRPPSALRAASFDSARSATPVQARARPSPLGAPVHGAADNESDDDGEGDGAESDGTAEATATIGSGLVAALPVYAASGANNKGKEKEKKGMKSRFKKAFGVSSSASAGTLTEAEVEGRGPKSVRNTGAEVALSLSRRDSASLSGDDDVSTTAGRSYATHQAQQPSVASSSASVFTNTDGMSTMTGTTAGGGKKPPSSRFRLLNNKFNGSSDNLSISSTVSSASLMIRKLGQMGKLARRNSLMGLTKAFKKDKGGGDDAATTDGALPTPNANKLSKKDKKKAGVASASVSHATAEVDSPSSSFAVPAGMSPAAALARKQQQAYAEQEAAEQRARDAAAAEAARLGPPARSFEQVPAAHTRSDSATSDVSSVRSGTEHKKGQRWRLGFGGGSKTDLHEQDVAAATGRAGGAAGYYDDATPRQSLEVLAPPQSAYQTYGASSAEREAGRASSEYEPSLYREGATPEGTVGRPIRGILKGAGSYRQEDFAAPRPPFARNRASSFDAPQQHGRPGSPGGAALVDVIPSEQQVDGVGPSTTSPRADTHPPTSSELMHDAATARVHPETSASGPYAHPGLNASAPALNQFSSSSPRMRPSPPATAKGRRIVFASNLSVHTTWPAAIYDRRAEPATCNRLTPLLAQQIKEELNSFKMEEMDVHPASRKLTHFFV